MDKFVECHVCNFEYSHILGTIHVEDDDDYHIKKLIIDSKYTILTNIKYEYRSQGNIHILFRCEDGHFFIKSFDGHKGIVNYDDNKFMEQLAEYLNQTYDDQTEFSFDLNFELIGNIEKYLRMKEASQIRK